MRIVGIDHKTLKQIVISSITLFVTKMNFEDFYTARKVLGEGAFGKIWEVCDTKSNEIFAMKVEAEKSFLLRKEFTILSKMQHTVHV